MRAFSVLYLVIEHPLKLSATLVIWINFSIRHFIQNDREKVLRFSKFLYFHYQLLITLLDYLYTPTLDCLPNNPALHTLLPHCLAHRVHPVGGDGGE
jgi:hypothetical protein